MPLLGQASGGWTESSSALRLLHVGIRNTVGVLTLDAFTQTNPTGALAGNYANPTSAGFDGAILGVLSGSVAFTRGDQGPNEIGGPPAATAAASDPAGVALLGVFINTAVGNDFENQPGVASDKGPYVSGQGTYANQLFETSSVAAAAVSTRLATSCSRLRTASSPTTVRTLSAPTLLFSAFSRCLRTPCSPKSSTTSASDADQLQPFRLRRTKCLFPMQ